jgi:hypothetical protein
MRSLAILCASILVLSIIPLTDTFAAKPERKFQVTVDSLKGTKTITLPDGRILERNVHIFYKDSASHVPNHQKGGKTDTCYALLAKGAKWKVIEPYIVDPANIAGMTAEFVRQTTAASLATWNAQVASGIFGSEVAGVVNGIDLVAPDGQNEVMFGSIDDPNVIAVTVTWGIFGGPPQGRELVEWDAIFDDVDFAWGDANTSDTPVMDYQNIGTHEFGHAGGLGHPSDSCTEETMYRFASVDETKKRDLNAGDIAGIKALYK